MEICAGAFGHRVCSTPIQPGDISCGVCILIEIQRIADGNIDSRRDQCSDAAELLRYRAKWTWEMLTNPAPTSSRGTDAAGIDDAEMGGGGTRRQNTGGDR